MKGTLCLHIKYRKVDSMSNNKIVWLLEEAAAQAQFQIRLQIPRDVIRKIDAETGIRVSVIDEKDSQEALCNLDWAQPFPNGLEPLQSFYVNGLNDEFPEVENLAQKLFIIALRQRIRTSYNCMCLA